MPNEYFDKVKAISDTIPYLRHLSIELLDAGEGWVKMKMTFRPEFLQPFVVHGGAIYSLADAAAAHALMTIVAPKEMMTTVEQRINFLKGVKQQDLFCEAQIVHLGKTLAYADVTVTFADGALVAKSTATLMRLERERFLGKEKAAER
ncbi:MAG TPA: PaaI family thioesterase [Blastocatellia bacterium]|nr:PaaI family thioesterase [Blastocatellia bacterium]